ncbi:MAG: GAF domain-containing protein [Deltaproteobacteria bacterium]|nr:GAF domain-containing protein [Deltaproteobacteria bacterium]
MNQDPRHELKRLERRARKLELLVNLGAEFHSERSFQRLLDKVWAKLTDVLEAERSSLFLLDDETDELYSVIAQQEHEIRFPKDRGIAGSVVSSGKPELVLDAYKDTRFNQEVDRKTGFVTRSIMSAPLKNSSGDCIGVTQVLNRRDGKPFDEQDLDLLDALSSIAGVAIETLQLVEEQKEAIEAVITTLVTTLDMRFRAEQLHSIEVRTLAEHLARCLYLDEDRVRLAQWAGALHDIGKLAISDSIMNKDAPLDDQERVEYERHAGYTKGLLEEMGLARDLRDLPLVAAAHHRWFTDGGFPKDLPAGRDLPIEARIVALADVLSAMAIPRWGAEALDDAAILTIIERQSGTKFDPHLVEVLMAHRDDLPRWRQEARAFVEELEGHDDQQQ